MSTHPQPLARWLSWGVASLLALGALALRLPGLDEAYTSDELANLFVRSAWEGVLDPESGINPPLLRWFFNWRFDGAATLNWARHFALVCSVGSVLFAYAVGLRMAAGRMLGGVIAASLLACAPHAIDQGTLFRSYAPWLLLMCWHLHAAVAFEQEGPERARRWGLQVAVSAMLLPWLHYVSVPILIALGLGSRRRFRWYLPAALACLPLVYLVLTRTEGRAPAGLDGQALWYAAQTALAGRSIAVGMLAMLLGVELALALARGRREPGGGVAYLGLVAVFVAVVLLSAEHFVRPVGALWSLPFLAALLARAAALPRPVWLAPVAGVLVLWLVLLLSWQQSHHQGFARGCHNQVRTAAHGRNTLQALRGERPLWISPGYHLFGFWTHVTSSHIDRAPGCGNDIESCILMGDMQVAPLPRRGAGQIPDGPVLHFEPEPDPQLSAHCRVVRSNPCDYVYDCAGPPADAQGVPPR